MYILASFLADGAVDSSVNDVVIGVATVISSTVTAFWLLLLFSERSMSGQNQQKQMVCSLFRFSQSLCSDDNAMMNKKPRRVMSSANGNSSPPGFIIRASLQRRGSRRHHRYFFRLSPVLSGLFVFFLFTFLYPSIITFDNIHRRKTIDRRGEDGLNVKGESAAVSLNDDLWSTRSSEFFNGCSRPTKKFLTADVKTHPHRYLLVSTSGGLNQQRTGIVDAVVAAYILNATLVVPMLDQKSYWKDASNFGDIFNVEWFISFLIRDVKITKQLPRIRDKVVTPYRTRVPRKCNSTCYLTRILPLLDKKNAVQLTKFDYRLSNRLDPDLQKLRCRVNYHALRFTNSILEMGKKLVERMRIKSNHFIALHLRFEPDILAFSGCDYGGGEKEKKELIGIRRQWKTLRINNPDKQRRQGRCPLTPEEVGLMLRALGFGSDVHIYVASGEVYGGGDTLAPLKALFPNFHSKDTLASKEELAPFASYSSRMAAIDFIVSDESDVFCTNNNGNMARILAGRRRYFGQKPTIRPNAKKLYPLFLNRNNMTWEEFISGVRIHQIGFMGELKSDRKGEFHENPAACMCKTSPAMATRELSLESDPSLNSDNGQGNSTRNEAAEAIDDESTNNDDQNDLTYLEYEDDKNGP
ncbi:hypothetical protein Nepgr_004752 [Nepenthes gracilis]|uniref:O-fucosyltransferase family protein n=1 Tax=Nepenthes gracilis TaxID=150966 RepID=A0AAD3S1V4_NEPGR|nr:hypothetical protein Nepgr_004752 [Nepenthes gracilis]